MIHFRYVCNDKTASNTLRIVIMTNLLVASLSDGIAKVAPNGDLFSIKLFYYRFNLK